MSDRLELWLVRHGETTANAARTISGWSDVDLTNLGRSQAKAARRILHDHEFDGVWSSDLKRAIATARLAHSDPKVDSRLREMHFGEMESTHIDNIPKADYAALLRFVDFQAPGGEHQEVFRDRVLQFAASLKVGRHLLFTHGGVIRMLTQDLGQDKFVKNGSVVALDWTAKKILFVKEALDIA